jgi:hypothetical protein
MMYTSRQVWHDYVRDDPAFARFGDYPLWVKYQQDPATDRHARRLTHNPPVPAPWNDWAIWQYSLDYTPREFTNLHHADHVTDLDVSNGGIHVLRGLANLGRPAPHGNGVRFVAHADENGVIQLLTFVGFWLESSLSDLAQSGGTARPLAAGDVTACDLGDRQFVAFRERSDGHLYEIECQNGAFSVADITSMTRTTNAAGDPTYVTSGSDRHLVCRGDDDHQYLFSNIANGAWQARDVTAGAGIANASGQATAYVFGGDVHVVGRAGADGHLVEAWHDGTAWNVVDRTTAGVPAATYQPSTYLGTDGFVRVVYRAVRGVIHESDHHVTDLDLAQAAGGAPTAAGNPVSVMAGQAPHIIYRRPDGFLHEIFWNGAAWAHGQLPCLERAVADPAALVTTEAGAPVLVVTFRRRDGAMQEVALRLGGAAAEPPYTNPAVNAAIGALPAIPGSTVEAVTGEGDVKVGLGGAVDQFLGDVFAGETSARKGRPNRMVDLPDVLRRITSFKSATFSGMWNNLPRADVADRLTQIVMNPDKLNQGGNSLCGPAAFFNTWILDDPKAFVQFALQLYNGGAAPIGSLEVRAGGDLRRQNYMALRMNMGTQIVPSADWMVMSAIRDSENAFFDYEGTPAEHWRGNTSSGEMVSWLEATRLYASVKHIDRRTVAAAKQLIPTVNRRIILEVDSGMIGNPHSGENDHFISMRTRIVTNADSTISFDYWTWGQAVQTAGGPGNPMTPADFERDYYGAIIAEF